MKSDRPTIRESAADVALRLIDAGYEAYFAGGCVRDRLLGREPVDYDIATSARPKEIAVLFRRVQRVGESFGVMLVRQAGYSIEVATFRTDGVYRDGRHPEEVTFSDAEHDARRRDFTINGLFQEPKTGRIIDYVGGQSDIKARVIRAIGDPNARLVEDRLRMLRAVRFAARFGFDLDAPTADAIRAGAAELTGVSRERIGHEVRSMLTHTSRTVAARILQSLGLDEAVFNEPHLTPVLTRLGRLADQTAFPTALGAWLLDRHDRDQADNPAVPSTADTLMDAIRRWSASLMLSNDERKQFRGAVLTYMTLRSTWSQLGIARQKRLASSTVFNQGMTLLQSTDQQRFIEISCEVRELSRSELAPQPLIDGEDLIGLGVSPGPIFSRVLEQVYDAQLEGTVTERDQARELAIFLVGDRHEE